MPGIKKLKWEHERFAQEYVRTGNQAEAYMVVWPKAGEGSAGSRGSKLLADPKIRRLVERYRRVTAKKYGVDAERVIDEMKKVAFSNVQDIAQWGAGWVRLKESAEVSREQAAAISEVSQTESGPKLKMHNKIQALEKLGNHLGLFTEKVEHKHIFGAEVDLSEMAKRTMTEMAEAEFTEVEPKALGGPKK